MSVSITGGSTGSGRQEIVNAPAEWQDLTFSITYPCWSLVPANATLSLPHLVLGVTTSNAQEILESTHIDTHLDHAPRPRHTVQYNANRVFTTKFDRNEFDENDVRFCIMNVFKHRCDLDVKAATYTQAGTSGICIALQLAWNNNDAENPQQGSKTFCMSQEAYERVKNAAIGNRQTAEEAGLRNTRATTGVLMYISMYVYKLLNRALVATLRQCRLECEQEPGYFSAPEHAIQARTCYANLLAAAMAVSERPPAVARTSGR